MSDFDQSERISALEAALSEAQQNKWPLGDRPNPCRGYSCNGVNIYGDEKSIDAAADAFHYAAQLSEYRQQFEAHVAQLQAALSESRDVITQQQEIINVKAVGLLDFEAQIAQLQATICTLRSALEELIDGIESGGGCDGNGDVFDLGPALAALNEAKP